MPLVDRLGATLAPGEVIDVAFRVVNRAEIRRGVILDITDKDIQSQLTVAWSTKGRYGTPEKSTISFDPLRILVVTT